MRPDRAARARTVQPSRSRVAGIRAARTVREVADAARGRDSGGGVAGVGAGGHGASAASSVSASSSSSAPSSARQGSTARPHCVGVGRVADAERQPSDFGPSPSPRSSEASWVGLLHVARLDRADVGRPSPHSSENTFRPRPKPRARAGGADRWIPWCNRLHHARRGVKRLHSHARAALRDKRLHRAYSGRREACVEHRVRVVRRELGGPRAVLARSCSCPRDSVASSAGCTKIDIRRSAIA